MYESDDEQSKGDRLVITGKYQTSVFYVRTSPYGLGQNCQDLGLIFSHNDHTLG